MKNTLIVIVLLGVICSHSSAQKLEFTTEWSKAQPISKSSFEEVISSDEDGVVSFHFEKTDKGRQPDNMSIKRVNNDMSVVNTTPMKFSADGTELIYQDYYIVNNELRLLLRTAPKGKGSELYYLHTLDLKSLEPKGDPLPLTDMDNLVVPVIHDSQITFSPDSSLYTLTTAEPKGKMSCNLNLYVFNNENHNLVFKKEIEFSFPADQLILAARAIDNSGDVHLLIMETFTMQNIVAEKPKFNYFMKSVIKNGTEIKDNNVVFDDLSITQARFITDNNNNLICAGLLAPNIRMSPNRTFFVKFDETYSEIDRAVTQIPNELIWQGEEPMQKKTMQKQVAGGGEITLAFSFIHDYFMTSDNRLIMVAEEEYHVTEERSHIRRDIYIMDFASSGKASVSKIAKYQRAYSSMNKFTSFSFVRLGDNCVFLFNDNPSNNLVGKSTKRVKAEIKITDKLELVAVQYSSNGLSSGTSVKRYVGGSFYISPTSMAKVAENKYLFFARNKKEQKFFELTLE